MKGLTPGPDLRNRNLCPSQLHLLAYSITKSRQLPNNSIQRQVQQIRGKKL